MTPQESAELVITCTATGLSGFPLWEYLPGMFVTSAYHTTDGRYRDPGRIVAVNVSPRGVVHLGICTVNGDLVSVRASWMRPDFVDRLTVQALYLLVCRAWQGHTLTCVDDQSGSVWLVITDADECSAFAHYGPAYAVFAQALTKVPVRQ